jgi:acyl-CoA synthetase (AMP-forming)/AMP-acid ligase II
MNATQITIDSVIRTGAAAHPSRPAVHDAGQTLSYAELDVEVDALACALLELGVEKGDRVASLFFNDWQAFVVYFAVVRIGAIVVPLNHRLVPAEIQYQLDLAECTVVVYADDLHPTVAPLAGRTSVRHWIAAGSRAPDAGDLRLEHLLEHHRGSRSTMAWRVTREDASGIWFTSGTTGRPKGALTTHDSAIWAAVGLSASLGMNATHRLLGVAPLFHRAPMEGLHLAGFLHGAQHVLLRHFDPAEMLGAIQDHGLTHGFIVPTMTFAVLSLPQRKEFDLRTMRAWMTASSPFPEEYRAALENETTLPPDVVYNAYGITESLLHTCLRPQDAAAHPGSVGQAVPGVLLRVVDGDRRTVPAGTVGEIAACAPSIASTYLRNSAAWDAVTFVEDGRTWYLSGDLGRMDEDGFLSIVDRVKDMVITGGENVYSAEVEQVLAHVPGVAEVAVIGVPDERWGECVTAVVVRAPESTLDQAQLLAGCADGLAPYKRPRRVHFVDSLPRNTFGKVQKQQLRELVSGSA